jgi:peptidoglycan/xylan/chitin deacetylase (PgdA/CDA1 family)
MALFLCRDLIEGGELAQLHPISPLGPVRLAITVDDMLLFRGSPMPPGYDGMGTARAFTTAFAAHRAGGVYGFSNTSPTENNPDLLRAFDHWVEHGHHIANHTHHHPSLNWVDAKAYVGDIERAAAIIEPWISQAPRRCFRYCMDMWGDTAEKVAAVRAYLESAHYTAVPISVGFHDARWLTPYWRTVKADDKEGAAWMRSAYVECALHELRLHCASARAVFGRDPVHIWLIHGTPIASDCLGQILDQFAAAGVEFVPLDEALSDPMNAAVPPRISPEFIHQVEKWAIARGVPVDDRPPAILAEIEKMHLAPGEGSPDIFHRMTGILGERLGAKVTPFPLADCQRG